MKRTRAEMIKLPEHSYVLSNNWAYQDWRCIDYAEHKNITNGWLMTQRNDKQLKEMFGRCSFATNEYEYYNRVWIVEHEDETYLIFSSEKGTSYEWVPPPPYNDVIKKGIERHTVLGKKFIQFHIWLVEKMRKLESNQEVIAEWDKFEKEQKEINVI